MKNRRTWVLIPVVVLIMLFCPVCGDESVAESGAFYSVDETYND